MAKKRILVYADRPGWAYDTAIKLLIENLGNEAEFYFDYCYCHLFWQDNYSFVERLRLDISRTKKNLYNFFLGKPLDYNYRLFFSHKQTPYWVKSFFLEGVFYPRKVLAPWHRYDIIVYLDFYFDFYAKLSKNSKFKIKGIYTDGFPPECLELDILRTRQKNGTETGPLSKMSFFKRYFKDIDLFIAGSQNIVGLYEEFPIPKLLIVGFYKEEIFNPNPDRIINTSELVIGWTGNPKREFKNFYTIVLPVVEQLISEGYNIRFKTRFEGPYDTLPRFYDDVDLVLIASTADAGPSLFAEAALMGVPSISTHVGYPAMVIQNNVNGFLVNVVQSEFREKIITLYNGRDLLAMFSKRIRSDYLQVFGKEVFLKNWRKALQI